MSSCDLRGKPEACIKLRPNLAHILVVIMCRYLEDGRITSDAFVIGVAGQYNPSLLNFYLTNCAKFNADCEIFTGGSGTCLHSHTN